MADTIYLELVVSSWPFRTGVLVYEPLGQLRIAEWNLQELSVDPVVLQDYATVLDPRLPYRRRAQAVLLDLVGDQELLRTALSVDDDQMRIEPSLSDDVERELGAWAKAHDLRLDDLALSQLPRLLRTLESWEPERHHRLVADWWEDFERPAVLQGDSLLRTQAGPGGSLYGAMVTDHDGALALWRAEQQTPLGEFSLYSALRVHWGWRLEFPDQPRPALQIEDQLQGLFGRVRAARAF